MKPSAVLAAAVMAASLSVAPGSLQAAAPQVCAECVRANMQRLAGDEFRGRKCGGEEEHAAAQFVADTLRRAKVGGAFGRDVYLQAVQLSTPTAAAPPTLTVTSGDTRHTFTQGPDFVALNPPESLAGELVLVSDAHAPPEAMKGKVVLYDSPIYDAPGVQLILRAGALAVITPTSDLIAQHWAELAARPPGRTSIQGVEPLPSSVGSTLFAKTGVIAALRGLAAGEARLDAPLGPPHERTTYNVIGVLHGKAKDADRQALLLTAHYDHLGVRDGVIFHGANDDASGTAAVLEFARILGVDGKHRRTVYFALWGCEEEGALGAKYFLSHPPMALSDLMANLEFEMIGVDDPKRPGALMLTGWERTDLGPALQAHGAHIGPDIYPEQLFFQRSDNYQLALRGVIAQTVSAWPVPPTYHAATDDLAHVDLAFMTSVIGSMVGPVTWLLDSDFQPSWMPGQRP